MIMNGTGSKLAFNAGEDPVPGVIPLYPAIVSMNKDLKEVIFVNLKVDHILSDYSDCPNGYLPTKYAPNGRFPRTQEAVSIIRDGSPYPQTKDDGVHPSEDSEGKVAYGGVFGYDKTYVVDPDTANPIYAKLVGEVEKIRKPLHGYYDNSWWSYIDNYSRFHFLEKDIWGPLEPGNLVIPTPKDELIICWKPSSGGGGSGGN